MCQRLFLIGLVLLFVGLQLRAVKSFELNERTSAFLAKRLPPSFSSTTTNYVSYNAYGDYGDLLADPTIGAPVTNRVITPPKWLAWSAISVGSVLVLTCPCFRQS